MKNIMTDRPFAAFAAAAVAIAALYGCARENMTNPDGDVESGSLVAFSAAAPALTRTMYNGLDWSSESLTEVDIFWGQYSDATNTDNSSLSNPDTLYIRSSEAKSGYRWAEYLIARGTSSTDGKTANIYRVYSTATGASQVNDKLCSQDDATRGTGEGIRWGDVDASHTFYSFYPSGVITGGYDASGAEVDINEKYKSNSDFAANDYLGDFTGNVVTAVIPEDQSLNTEEESINGASYLTANNVKYLRPKMSCCMMWGKGTWAPGDKNIVDIKYSAVPAVLDVTIPYITNYTTTSGGDSEDMKIISVTVKHNPESSTGRSKLAIVGNVSVNLADGTVTLLDDGAFDSDAATVNTQSIGSNDYLEPVTISSGQSLNVKFFLAAGSNTEASPLYANDLDLTLVFSNGGTLTRKIVTTSSLVQLQPGKITRVTTPTSAGSSKIPVTSNWMSRIDDNVMFSQLSIPGSKNSFAYTGFISQTVSDVDNTIQSIYQNLSIADQFAMGIRGFDVKLVLNSASASGYASATDLVLYSGNTSYDTENLEDILSIIHNQLTAAPTECAVLYLSYAGKSTDEEEFGAWYTLLMDKLASYVTTYDTTPLNDMAKKIGDLRGKIILLLQMPSNSTDYYVDANIMNSGDSGPFSTNSSYITHIFGVTTSMQNADPVSATVNYISSSNTSLNAVVYGQNLQQCNNPAITDADGYFRASEATSSVFDNAALGLMPFYAWYENSTVGVDLMARKIKLAKDVVTEAYRYERRGATTGTYDYQIGSTASGNSGVEPFFINDIGGFCVVKDVKSTGYIRNKIWTSSDDGGSSFVMNSGTSYNGDMVMALSDISFFPEYMAYFPLCSTVTSGGQTFKFYEINYSYGGTGTIYMVEATDAVSLTAGTRGYNFNTSDTYTSSLNSAISNSGYTIASGTLYGAPTTVGINLQDLTSDNYHSQDNNYRSLGNGGNPALFAQYVNTLCARELFSSLRDDYPTPLGLVLMNFAGVETYTVGGKEYHVSGQSLPGMIVNNNFRFRLRTASSE